MQNFRRNTLALLTLFWATVAVAQAPVEVKELETRPGVQLRFLYAKAAQPLASAVLFQGGEGNIGIFDNGSTREDGFLAGGAQRFTQAGISVAIPDVPSDRRILRGFRDTAAHAQDNAAILAFLRREAQVPAWAVGISNGSLCAAAMATHLGADGPDGLVLASSVTKDGVTPKMAQVVHWVPLHSIRVPVLLVHHEKDGCYVTPYGAMANLKAAFKASPEVALLTVSGGSSEGNPCHSSHHQFLGIEAQVTQDIAAWMARRDATPR